MSHGFVLTILLLQETEAAVDATISQVLAAVEPLETAWRTELQRLQVIKGHRGIASSGQKHKKVAQEC